MKTPKEPQFNQIIQSFEAQFDSHPTIDQQRDNLEAVQERHKQQQTELGTIARLTDLLPENFPSGPYETHLWTQPLIVHRHDQPNIHETGLWLNISVKNPTDPRAYNNVAKQVASFSYDGDLVVKPGFTQEDAELVTAQYQELDELKIDGTLPNLNLNHSDIASPRPKLPNSRASAQIAKTIFGTRK